MPKLDDRHPGLFPGSLNSPGTLQLLALMLIFAGLALTYDLLFGFTGLLSFGHALYFAVGVYVAAIAMTQLALGLLAVGPASPRWSGSCCRSSSARVSLRVSGIAFAMVTLAFAQAGSVLALKNPYGWTGGEEGFGVDYTKLPAWTVGILNTKNLYWLALGYAAAVFAIGRWAVNSSPGHVWQAIRENELRVEVLGLRPYDVQADVVRAGVVPRDGRRDRLPDAHQRRELERDDPELHARAAAHGRDRRHRLALGRDDRRASSTRMLDHRLADLSRSHAVSRLPSVLRDPLQQPLFILGVLFILVVFFVPGGLTRHRTGRRPARPDPAPAGDSRRRPHEHQVGVAGRRYAGAADPRARLHPLGLGPIVPRPRARYRVISFDNRGIGESDIPQGPYTVEQLAGDAVQVLDEAGVERAHVLGASLGGIVAQERRRRAGPTGRPARARAAPRRAGPASVPLPEVTLRLMAEAPSLAPEVALRRFVENAVAPGPPAELVDEIFAYGRRIRPIPAGWAAQAAAGQWDAGGAGADRGADARRHRHRRQGRRPPQLGAARRADPGRARSS